MSHNQANSKLSGEHSVVKKEPRLRPVPGSAPLQFLWECPECTFRNTFYHAFTIRVCEMCEHSFIRR